MRFQPLVLAFAHKAGLGDQDAQDAAQETMLAAVTAYRAGQYDRRKGRLRSWLFGIAHRKVLDVRRRRKKEQVITDRRNGTAFLEGLESPPEAERVWEEEWESALLRACLTQVTQQVDARAFECFRLCVMEGWSPTKVAGHLGVSRNAVYIHKHRIIRRLRDLQRQLEEAWG